MGRTVIKAGARVEGPVHGMYSVDLRDIAQEASHALKAAHAEADRIVQAARRQSEADRKTAREQGLADGRRAGFEEGRTAGYAEALADARTRFAGEQEALVTQLAATLQGFSERREHLYLTARRDVVVLAIAIASRVAEKLAGTAEAASEMAIQAVEEALSLVGKTTEAVIRVNPEAWESMRRFAGLTDEPAGGRTEGMRLATGAMVETRHVSVVQDPAVPPGGVIVETADCEIDARLRERIERVATELLAGWRSRMESMG